MDEPDDLDGQRLLALFDAAEEYAPLVDQMIAKHKGQALPLLLMLAVNLCLIIDMEAEKEGKSSPVMPDDHRRKLDEYVEAIVR